MLSHVFDLWGSYYSDHAAIRTAVDFLHVAGLLVGGGAAIVADRAALSLKQRAAGSAEWLDSFRATHRVVLTGIVMVLISGSLMVAADRETYLYARVFWLKMGLFFLLLLNGSQLVRAERLARLGTPRGRQRLRLFAGVSLSLWFLTTLAGAALANVA